MRRFLSLACVVALLLSGCTGGGGKAKASPSPTTSPVADAETGSITGNVTDDELKPIFGVEVALVETAAIVRTDSLGSFTFNGLAPGRYSIVATRVGFDQTGKKVDVKAAEISYANLVMEAIAIPEEGHHLSIPSTFYISFGWGLFDAFVTWRVSNATCNPCQRMIDFERGPVSTVAEPVWTPSVDTPATNQQLYIWTERNVDPAATSNEGENVWSKYVSNREQHWFTEQELKKLETFKDFRVNVGGGVTSVMLQQRVDVWMSFGYVQKLPDTFTALPPE